MACYEVSADSFMTPYAAKQCRRDPHVKRDLTESFSVCCLEKGKQPVSLSLQSTMQCVVAFVML